jgi:hypothetical protein
MQEQYLKDKENKNLKKLLKYLKIKVMDYKMAAIFKK